MYLKEKPRHIIFDLDGVLWDSSMAHKNAYLEALKSFKIKVDDIDYSKIEGISTIDGMRYILDKIFFFDEVLINSLVNTKKSIFLKQDIVSFKLNRELISWIKSNHNSYCISIGTSASKASTDKFLKISGLKNLIKNVVSIDNVLKGKPDPEIFNKCISFYDVDKKNTIVVEDSNAGVIAAAAAGVGNIFVLQQFNESKINLKSKNIFFFKTSKEIIDCL